MSITKPGSYSFVEFRNAISQAVVTFREESEVPIAKAWMATDNRVVYRSSYLDKV